MDEAARKTGSRKAGVRHRHELEAPPVVPAPLMLLAEEAIEQVLERSRAEQRVSELTVQKELREQYISLLSHDLRTPLAAAKVSADLILKRSSDPELCRKLALQVSQAVTRADQMVQNLLDASRIRAGAGMLIHPLKCSLAEVVKRATVELRQIHGSRANCVILQDVQGIWDADALRRAIENLVNNAAKYGASDTPITLSLAVENGFARISVHNHGNELSPREVSDLFQWFKRSPKAVNSQMNGWGLGLVLVKGIAEAHGGEAEVSSEPGKGTTFSLKLPVAGVSQETAPAFD